jgi:hypothetical protein
MVDISNIIINDAPSIKTPFYSKKPEYVGPMGKETSDIDGLLEREKQHNKSESWTKLDKTAKLQKLLGFSEKYSKEHNLTESEKQKLVRFFSECLEKNKLLKTKDIMYNKDTKEIINIPSLHFHSSTKHFTLKVMDAKRVSTIKSLTPKRIIHVDQIQNIITTVDT